MKGFDPSTSFGDATSRDYDAVSMRGDEDETVAFLALELAVGTGRIALPLRAAGVRVDASSCPRTWSTGCARSRAATRSR